MAACGLAALCGAMCVSSQSLSRTYGGAGSSRSVFLYVATKAKMNTSQFTDDLANRYQMPYCYSIIPLAFYNDILCLILRLQFEYSLKAFCYVH